VSGKSTQLGIELIEKRTTFAKITHLKDEIHASIFKKVEFLQKFPIHKPELNRTLVKNDILAQYLYFIILSVCSEEVFRSSFRFSAAVGIGGEPASKAECEISKN
jgi:hypothetical protein